MDRVKDLDMEEVRQAVEAERQAEAQESGPANEGWAAQGRSAGSVAPGVFICPGVALFRAKNGHSPFAG